MSTNCNFLALPSNCLGSLFLGKGILVHEKAWEVEEEVWSGADGKGRIEGIITTEIPLIDEFAASTSSIKNNCPFHIQHGIFGNGTIINPMNNKVFVCNKDALDLTG